MPDRSFALWLVQRWPRTVLFILTFALVWLFLMMGIASTLHQSENSDKAVGEHAKITTEATRAAREATETRKAVERLEKRLDVIGDGRW